MTVNFYPKNLLVSAVFLIAFGSLLSVATDLRRGAMVGGLAVLAYLLIEVFAAVNPAVWWQERRNRR
jgi:hypothetical protein